MWIFFLIIFSIPVILGNQYFSSKLIQKAFKKGPNEVLNLYKDEGFLNATIKVYGDTILIKEGVQFKIGDIKLNGNQAFSDSELLGHIELNKIFNEFELTKWIEKVLECYENSGYPFCKIKLDSLEIGKENVDFELQIFEGPLVIIDTIRLSGNDFTKDYVVLRELNIEPGDTFCEKIIYEANQRIQRLEFIESCNISLEGKDELLVQTEEGPANWINGALGYGTPGLMGFLDLEILNLFGTGRAVGAKWQKRDTISVQFEIRYKEPWLLGSSTNLIASASHNREATYVKNRAEILFDVPINSLLRANVGWCGKWIVLHSTYFRDSQSLGVLGVDFDIRPDFSNMSNRKGVHYQVKSEFNFTDTYIEKLTINLDNYINFFFLSLNFETMFKEEIQIYDNLRFGGAQTLRGYWEGEFSGTQIGWLNLELRKSIGNKSFIFPFYDLGYIRENYQITPILKYSFGTGIAVDSPIGLVKVVYGLAGGASFMDGKIHFLIRAEF